MKRELGIARCGLAYCICSKNDECRGCRDDSCSGTAWCENRKCSIEKNYNGCFDCRKECSKGVLAKIKPSAFRLFVQRFGTAELLACLERNEIGGIVYHRSGTVGDYDDFDDVERVIEFIKTGKK